MIATRLHKLVEDGCVDPLLDDMLAAAKYCIADDLMEILPRADVQTSIAAMIEAGVARLPFSPLLLEFRLKPSPMWHFVLLEEIGNVGTSIRARQIYMGPDYSVVSPSRVECSVHPGLIVVDKASGELEAASVGIAVSIALLMLNIRGVDKQVIETGTLNRARAKRNRPPIPRHTLLRIGTIYDWKGGAHRHGDSTGRRMPVHLRAGHCRNQACGEGFRDHKVVYIPPVLVNFRPGDAIPVPTKLVTV